MKFNIRIIELWFWKISIIILLVYGVLQFIQINRLYIMFSVQNKINKNQEETNLEQIIINNQQGEINYNNILIQKKILEIKSKNE